MKKSILSPTDEYFAKKLNSAIKRKKFWAETKSTVGFVFALLAVSVLISGLCCCLEGGYKSIARCKELQERVEGLEHKVVYLKLIVDTHPQIPCGYLTPGNYTVTNGVIYTGTPFAN